MRILVFLFALLSTHIPASAAGFVSCPEKLEFYRQVRESNDERVSAIFTEVLVRSNIRDKKFALCESDEFSPGVFPILREGKIAFAIVLPKAFSEFSDAVVSGVIAHEIGHIRRTNLSGGKTAEYYADLEASDMVGKDTLIEALRAMQKNIKRFPKWQQDIGKHYLQYRLNALIYGLYEVY